MINKGQFKENKYIKKVTFSKAVLWKDRELSLPVDIIAQIKSNRKIKTIEFIDDYKGETWIYSRKKLFEIMYLKQVGQEPQYYFSIAPVRKVKKEDNLPVNSDQAMLKMATTPKWEELRIKLHTK